MTALLATRLLTIEELVLTDPLWGACYAVNGALAKEGDTIKRTALAETLQKISDLGAEGSSGFLFGCLPLMYCLLFSKEFYLGETAQIIVEDLQKNGGIITMADMSAYQVKTREPITGFYRGMRVITSPPPSSGPVLLFLLNVLEGYDLEKLGPSGDAYQLYDLTLTQCGCF